MAGVKKLTEKEELFCQSYLIDFNGARAARDAGYSEHTAKQIATENLSKPYIRERIHQLRVEMGKAFNITRERIAQEYSRLAFVDIRKILNEDGTIVPPVDWDDDTAAAISSMETDEIYETIGKQKLKVGDTKKVKLSDKRAALDSLVKLMGYAEPDKHIVDLPTAIRIIRDKNV